MKLGNDQKQALSLILSFINSEKIAFTLSGFAGTGKSYLTLKLIEELEKLNINFTICAPTHKAKVVIERFTGREGLTLHKLLSLSPNIQILDLDFRDLKFLNLSKSALFPYNSTIICDEASMVNDELYELLIAKCTENSCKIIFIGDIKQIKPVNASYSSKVFDLKDSFFLTEIFRQDLLHPLTNILTESRERFISKFNTIESENGSIKVHTVAKDFFMEAVPYFRKAIDNLDILETKIISYTNDRTNSFNCKMREALFGLENEYNKFEFLTAYETIVFGDSTFWNSMDYIIIEEPIKTQITIAHIGIFPGYKLILYDSSNKVNLEVNILSRNLSDKEINFICFNIEEIRLEAIRLKQMKSRMSGKKWKEYYEAINSFTTPVDLYYDGRLIRKKSFDYGYASTIHKIQGSSINNVFIDMKSISLCRDTIEKRQLQYVALSRTKNNIYILQ
jgi:hypothetical protein